MPYKSDSKPLPPGKDRRVKLTREQRDEIAANPDRLSQRALAHKYNVSRRTITFILDPDKLVVNLQRRKERGGSSLYYYTQTHTESVRTHRRYKHVLYYHPNASLCDQCHHMWEGQDKCPKCHGVISDKVWVTHTPIK